MNFGQIIGEPASVYHKTDAVGSHKLEDFSESELLYFYRYVSKEAPERSKTKSLTFGQYFHALAVEGEAAAEAVAKELDKEEARLRIKQDDKDLAWQMVKAIRAKPTAKALFDHGQPEVVFRHRLASFAIQARIDWFDERRDEWQRPTLIDVKSIDSLANFDKHFLNYGYFTQAAFYQLVVQQSLSLPGAFPRFLFVVVEKDWPFQVSVREPDEAALDIGRTTIMNRLKRLKECYDTNTWHGEPDAILPVTLPDWKLMKGAD